MFTSQFFAPRYFAPRYWPRKTPVSAPAYFPHRYFPARYFAPRFFPPLVAVPVPPPEPPPTPTTIAVSGGSSGRRRRQPVFPFLTAPEVPSVRGWCELSVSIELQVWGTVKSLTTRVIEIPHRPEVKPVEQPAVLAWLEMEIPLGMSVEIHGTNWRAVRKRLEASLLLGLDVKPQNARERRIFEGLKLTL